MKIGFSILTIFIFTISLWAQKTDINSNGLLVYASSGLSVKKRWTPNFYGDRQWSYRLHSPMLMALAATPTRHSDSYWLSSMTSQSYNSGKVGTYYYWDVSGNLCESRTYLDIAGKHKRGLKLIFRRR